jgi:hypothetical protein
MQKLKTLSVTFSEPIEPQELECFRGAVVEKVGQDREWYHNHNNQSTEKGGYHYRYPLIQYKLNRKRPMIVFINEAIDEARHFFVQPDWNMTMANRSYQVKIEQLKARQLEFGIVAQPREYRIRRWLALNMKNFPIYQELPTMRDRLIKLEQLLANNILSMATSLGYRFPERFDVEITDFYGKQPVQYKGNQLLVFNLSFRTNVVIPFGLSLGKGSSLGFGTTSLVHHSQEEIAASPALQTI